jgi:hypothetical protein
MARRRVLTPVEVEQARAGSSPATRAAVGRTAAVLGRLQVRPSAGENRTTATPARRSLPTVPLARKPAIPLPAAPRYATPSPAIPLPAAASAASVGHPRRRARPLRADRTRRRDRPLRAKRAGPASEAKPPPPSHRKVPTRVFHMPDEVRRSYELTPAAGALASSRGGSR